MKLDCHKHYINSILYTNNEIQSKWTHLKDIVKKIWLSKCYTQLMTQIKFSIQLATTRMVN
jgi:hypothetical protein